MELLDEAIVPIDPDAGSDIDDPLPSPAGAGPLVGGDIPDPPGIEEPFEAAPAEGGEAWTVSATATPPIKRAPATHTVATPDHHSRVAGLARLHPVPSPLTSLMMRLPVCVPQGHRLRIRSRHEPVVTP